MQFDRAKFFKEYRRQFGALEHPFQVEGLNALLDAMSADAKLTDVRIAAYMLATVHHECQLPINKVWKPTYQPVEERGKGRGRKYAKSYPVSRHDAVKTAVYYGRGYVQLTWLDNYRKAGTAVGVDLVNYPEKALEPAVAYLCLAEGLRRGWYGSKIITHINGTKCDYFNARRCVNILDKAAQIAEYAEKFERALRVSLTQDAPRAAAQAEDESPEMTMPANDVEQDVAADPAAGATPAPAHEGEPAPTEPAREDEAIVGGRPSDLPVEVKAGGIFEQFRTKVKAWWVGGTTGAATFGAAVWGWLTKADHLLVIGLVIALALVGTALAIGILWLKNKREERAQELAKLQLQIAADPTKYNAVVVAKE